MGTSQWTSTGRNLHRHELKGVNVVMNEKDMPNFPRRQDLHAKERAQTPTTPEESGEHVPPVEASSFSFPSVRQPRTSSRLPSPPKAKSSAAHDSTLSPHLAPPPQDEAHSMIPSRRSLTASPAPTVVSPVKDEELETTGIRSRRIELEQQRARKRIRNRRIRSFFIIVLVLSLLGGATYAAWRAIGDSSGSTQSEDDYSGSGGETVTITIYEGALGSDIGRELVDKDVVKSMDAFLRAFEANKAASSIRPGTYTLKTRISAADAIAALLDDKNRDENNVTVIPGDTLAQTIQRMKDVTDFNPADIDSALRQTDALGLPAQAGGNLEGWLAPGTYELSSDETPQSLLKEMVAARVSELEQLKIAPEKWQEVLIKASILEREVNIDQYLGKVARVIENRLADPQGETQGLLQMDSTVSYAVGRTSGVPTAAELATDSPYNTYKVKGLPVGPIATPALPAIEATLNPEPGTWLYFVTVDLDTGETRFASTIEEHKQNEALLDQYCSTHTDKCHK